MSNDRTGLLRELAESALRQDLDQAIAEQLALAEKEPGNPKPYVALGAFFQMQGRRDDAALMYRHALGLDSQFALAHQYLGQLLAAQGDLDAAWQHAHAAAGAGNRVLLDLLERHDSHRPRK